MPDDPNPNPPPSPAGTATPLFAAGEKIAKINVADEIKNSFLDYSMSVIVARALPDARDGLKPSQRRILYAMHDLGVMPNRKHIKCAKIVGETMGNYHPHGDQAIYPTLVHMAQPWSMRERLVDGPARVAGGVAFSVDLQGGGAQVGWRAKPHTGLIDLDRIAGYDPREFWEEVHAQDGRIILDPGAFYILVSREAVHVPPDYAAEMAPYLAMVGEFRVHYAGFFDPGFGHGPGQGARGVLEVRCHEAPFALEHGQTVGRLVYERMAARPERLYGSGIASNYQGQGLKLAKQFA